MSAELIWSAFAATGDPMVYLLYRASLPQTQADDDTERARGDAAG